MDYYFSFAYSPSPSFQQEEERFSSFFQTYLTYRSTRVRESSLLQAKTVYSKYLSSWHELPLSIALNASSIKEIYTSITSSSLCPSWKNRIIGVIRSMAKAAFLWKKIDAELYQDALAILENVPEGNTKQKNKPIWSKKDEEKFLSSIDDEQTKIMFRLFIALGARLSEFLGLTWDCFNARNGTIEIKQQLMHNSQRTFAIVKTLKTKESYRVCRLDKATRDALLSFRKSLAKPKGFIFVSPIDSSKPMSKACFRARLAKYIRLSGVKKITPHGVRHAKASNLMKACKNMLDVVAVAKYMGHTPSVLLNTYSHEQEKAIDKIMKRLDKIR